MLKEMTLATLLLMILCLGSASHADAAPITFTFQGTGSGTVGTQSFTDSAFTISLSSDTTAIIQIGEFYRTPPASATINLAGIGTGTFTQLANVITIPDGFGAATFVGLELPANSLQLNGVTLFSATLNGYTLQGPIGPISNRPAGSGFLNAPTTLGQVQFTNYGNTLTFTATLGTPGAEPVPEPTTMLLLATGIVGGAVLRKRKPSAKADVSGRE